MILPMIPKLLMSIAVLITGAALAWYYLRKAPDAVATRYAFAGLRPWRKVGAALCLLISVMFVLGIYVVDIPDRPIPYALYRIIMLGLIVWLFVLAVRDIMYTRALVRRRRLEISDSAAAAEASDVMTSDPGNFPT